LLQLDARGCRALRQSCPIGRERRYAVEKAVLAKVQDGLDEKGSEVNIEKNMIEMAKLKRPEDGATVERDVLEVTKKVIGRPH
jgi:hypothetical protein